MSTKKYVLHVPAKGYWVIENQIPSWTDDIQKATRFDEKTVDSLPWMHFTHDPSNRWILVQN